MTTLNQKEMSKDFVITKSAEETRKLAENFAKKLKPGDFIAFFGNLGSGKTTFIQGLAKGLGIKRRIISPTFIIVRTYKLQPMTFYHIDLYRTESLIDLLGLGIDQIIKDKTCIVALEWAEKMGELLPEKRIEVHFEDLGQDTRKITINYINE
jgi:tRNA threonylcarbamoyladenosine biosynthesis protein TsaE